MDPPNSPTAAPTLCSGGCGFFGNPATMNLCSQCFKTHATAAASSTAAPVPAKAQPPVDDDAENARVTAAVATPAKDSPPSSSSSETVAMAETVAETVTETETVTVSAAVPGATESPTPTPKAATTGKGKGKGKDSLAQKNTATPGRCFRCRKKVGLVAIRCRCGETFCSAHRDSFAHECTFDFKSMGRESLAKANPVVKGDKVARI